MAYIKHLDFVCKWKHSFKVYKAFDWENFSINLESYWSVVINFISHSEDKTNSTKIGNINMTTFIGLCSLFFSKIGTKIWKNYFCNNI